MTIETLQKIFDKDNTLKTDWRKTSNVNFHYANSGKSIGAYADELFGNYYIQNDYDQFGYSEKFLLIGNDLGNETELKIVTGPYGADFESQKYIVNNWAQKVKELSENK